MTTAGTPRNAVLTTDRFDGELILVDCVVDLDAVEELIGVEVLEVRMHSARLASALAQGSWPTAGFRVSYDTAADALYVVKRERVRSTTQKTGVAALLCDAEGALVALSVRFE